MQVIQQTRTSINISGYVDRLERGIIRKNLNLEIQRIREPVPIQRPIIEDLTAQVVVHDQVEQYV